MTVTTPQLTEKVECCEKKMSEVRQLLEKFDAAYNTLAHLYGEAADAYADGKVLNNSNKLDECITKLNNLIQQAAKLKEVLGDT